MLVPTKHILSQGPVLGAIAQTAWAALMERWNGRPEVGPIALPGPPIAATLPPRPADLVRDYLRHVGSDPGAYRGTLPAHLFPQWGFGLTFKTLDGIPYPLARVMNAGCRLEMRRPLPAEEPLQVRARLASIDDNGRRAVLAGEITTGTRSAPEALLAEVYSVVPLGEPKHQKGGRDTPRVPARARELGFWRLRQNEGFEFAQLTGDFNPIHWVPRYARAFGFRNVILHGFSTLARAIEGLNRGLFAGRVDRLRVVDVKFTRPVVLPAAVGLYIDGRGGVFVGDAPGGPAYMTGTYEISE
jgi:hypothetical protein